MVKKYISDFVNVTGGVPQSCKLGPITFVIKINMLPSVIEQVVAQGVNNDVVVDENGDFLHARYDELEGARCS